MPAFGENKWYCLIFVVFLLLTMYIFLSILLAVVYDGYRGHLKVCFVGRRHVTLEKAVSRPPHRVWLLSPGV